ncbi:tRNA (adenosine(37)-N6)-dimethylallyltransferase MiaA [Risungbinella massiliensis]|uniref:tRNA (adenosine(37)-N6)-dimethylallyltransferase MiaA n=1 Tax=Risungbinella massiliensis TaxID=1329796 RepID=UPI000B0A4290|nr:tRNA (adenosine(37)-N6)-dimethylallyltransferase MiaA [Risungbinella massiliensis]
MAKQPVVLIVGPTAVGKTALSLTIAEQFKGEIISGDSMQVYRGMDIGTAKATPEERSTVPHHLIDILDPSEPFSVQLFQKLARHEIDQIASRGHLPIVAGGTGLYVEALVYEYQMPNVTEDPAYRQKWWQFAVDHGAVALHQELHRVDPASAVRIHPNDTKRIIRAMEVTEKTGIPFSELTKKGESRYDALWIGLTMPRDQLYERINKRVDLMIEEGLLEEVKGLREAGYHLPLTSIQAIGYKEIYQYLEGELSLEAAIERIKKGTRNYAKRQLSWFRRMPDIQWFDVTNPNVFTEIPKWMAGKFSQYRE